MSYRGRGRGGFRGGYQQQNPQNINDFISSNSVPVEILGWNGASSDDCIKFISRKCRIVVLNPSVDPATGVLKGYVKNQKEADDLCNWSGVKFAGQSLRITKSIVNGVAKPGNSTIETITEFLKSRYQPDIKLLNLSAVQQDQNLVSKGFFASISTTSKFFPALMKVASELKIEADSIDLSNNNLNDLSTISTLSQTFPTLKNLSLMNNNFSKLKTFETWRHKLNFLRELIITGNPILNQASPEQIKIELMKLFPRLIVVNGEILRNEEALLNNLKFPFNDPQQMFFQDDEIQNMSTNFVTNFYNLWDSNRQELMQLYQQQSQFSLSVDMSHPHPVSGITVDFGYYLPFSRNLTKISASKTRMAKLSMGQEQIFKSFSQLPKTKHELLNKPNLFSMESYRFPPLNGILINLHGSFQETDKPDDMEGVNNANQQPHNRNRYQNRSHNHNNNKKIPLSEKSFDRTFIVIPGPNGSMIVASDSLIIRNPSGSDAWKKVSTPSPAPQTPPPAGVALPAGVVPPVAQPTPTTADLPPDIKAMFNQIQQETLVKVLLETRLNLQYGVMLCQQSNWDYQQCIVNFKNSVGSLPPDAYA